MKTMICISPLHSISLATLLFMPSLGSLPRRCLLWAIFKDVPFLEDHHIANTTVIRTGKFWQLQLKKVDDVDNALKSVLSRNASELTLLYTQLEPLNTPTISFDPSPFFDP